MRVRRLAAPDVAFAGRGHTRPGDLSDPVHAVDRRPAGEHLRGLRAALVPSSTEDSSVYHAMWLLRITLSSAAGGLSAGSGSRSNTSRPAAGADHVRASRRSATYAATRSPPSAVASRSADLALDPLSRQIRLGMEAGSVSPATTRMVGWAAAMGATRPAARFGQICHAVPVDMLRAT